MAKTPEPKVAELHKLLGLSVGAKIELAVCEIAPGEYQLQDMVSGAAGSYKESESPEIHRQVTKLRDDRARMVENRSKPKVPKAPTLSNDN